MRRCGLKQNWVIALKAHIDLSFFNETATENIFLNGEAFSTSARSSDVWVIEDEFRRKFCLLKFVSWISYAKNIFKSLTLAFGEQKVHILGLMVKRGDSWSCGLTFVSSNPDTGFKINCFKFSHFLVKLIIDKAKN